VPCHRVVSSDRRLGGYCGKLENPEKVRLLEREGIVIRGNRIELREYLHRF
jgi:alkylated DNA nucleotide flippase Atl1